MACKRCGNCCQSMVIKLDNITPENDAQEYGKWIASHKCDVSLIDGCLAFTVPITCSHFSFNDDTGICTCKVYDTRPKICKDYLCKRAIDG